MIKRTLFFGNPCYLSTERGNLKISFPENKKEDVLVPIEDIGVILLEHPRITITHRLLSDLSEKKVVVITCDKKHLPNSISLPVSGHTEQTQRFHNQISISKPLKGNLWKQTVQKKILNQARLLSFLDKKDGKLRYWAKMVESHDQQNHEGFASAYYWQELFGQEFIRDRYGLPPNNLLNYGYAILRAVVARAIVSSGLHPSIGLFHKNKYNAFCLADDLMEPYRIFVDAMVYSIVTDGMDFGHLSIECKKILLQIPAIDVRIGKRTGPLMTAVSRTTSSLYDCIVGKRRKLLYPVYDARMDE